MEWEALEHRYPSVRNIVYGRKGMVCTSQPLAAQAGLDALKQGGNAVDAAIAAAACLTVVEPSSNGIGSDCFALVWKEGRLYGLNGSGPSPALLRTESVREAGLDRIPEKGWLPVTVPGAPAAWAALNGRFGRRPLKKNLEPAAAYAREGFPVSPVIAGSWQEGVRRMEQEDDREEFREWRRVFTRDGRGPKAGELWRFPDHAETLLQIAETDGRVFYAGELADRMDAWARKTGGFLRKSDLERYEPEWVEPLSVTYRGYEVWELPPNGHGIVALMALNMLEEVKSEKIPRLHAGVEAVKLAFADGLAYIADPKYMGMPAEAFLQKSYAKQRAACIGERARLPECGDPYSGGTVYLCAADEDGMMVSLIQSGYDDFGSGIVVPGTGINLQDRGCSFSLEPGHPNALGPGKRPYNTIIPGFLTKNGEAAAAFGVIGGLMQPQGHVQILSNLLEGGMHPQDALNAPRWQWREGRRIEMEAGFGQEAIARMRERGHEVTVPEHSYAMGRGQIVWRMENGVYAGATDPRGDGSAEAW